MKKILCLLFSLISVQGMAQDNTDFLERSRQILNMFVNHEFEKIHQQLDTTVSNRMDTVKLSASWEKAQKYGGAFVKILDLTEDQELNNDVVEVHCQFEKKKIKLKVIYDKQRLIKALLLVPDEQIGRYSNPVYYNPIKIREYTKVIGLGEFRLPGILTVPKTPGRHPVIILVHGSGANDKDETVGPMKIFKDLAAGLAAQGVAVFRYDKRNRVHAGRIAAMKYGITAKEETIDDAISALNVLKTDTTIDTTKIYMLGHSLGGYLMPRIAAQCTDLKGIILLGANSQPLEDVIRQQSEYLMNMDTVFKQKKEMLDSLHAEVAMVKQLSDSNKFDTAMYFHLPIRYWLDLKKYDPIATAMKLSLPMLILHGQRDYQVSMIDYNKWVNGLKLRKRTTFRKYVKLNHFFVEGAGKSSMKDYRIGGNV